MRGRRITAITSASQADDEGSTPFARSRILRRSGSRAAIFIGAQGIFEGPAADLRRGYRKGTIHPELSKFFVKYAKIHSETIRKTGAEPLFMATWAYKGRPEMTAQLMDATTKEANANKAMVVPVGLAFAKSLAGRPDLTMTIADNRHPTAAGTYLEAAVLFATLTKTSPEGADFVGACEKPLAKADAAWLQKVAWETVTEFFGWK